MKKTLALAVLTPSAATAFAHAKLQTSTPAAGSTVSAPSELRLKYNESVEVAMSSIKLTGPGNSAVMTDRAVLDPSDDKTLVLAMPKLAPGGYHVRWSTMGRDGHHTKGEFQFTVK